MSLILESYFTFNALLITISIWVYDANFCHCFPFERNANVKDVSRTGLEKNINVTIVKGDIVFRHNPVSFYMAPKDKYRLWTNRVIPYTLDPGYNEFHRERIVSAMEAVEEETCLRFVKRRREFDYVLIVNGKAGGCYSDVGRVGGQQTISLPVACLTSGLGVTIHELSHTLGLWHEHNRPDRDKYVKVIFKNIIPNKRFNFEKREENMVDLLGFEYDYGSIMHYGNKDFSLNGDKTIRVTREEYDRVIGQRRAMSQIDIDKINSLYKCDIMSCPNPEKVNDGNVISSGPYMVGDSVRYECNAGTETVGSSVRTCKFDGEWSGLLLQCLDPSTFVWCDFETDMCGFTHYDDNDFDWNRMSNALQLEYAAPLVDHTSEETKGFYVYAESEIQKPGQVSKLISPEFRVESREDEATLCLSFSYSMWGGTGQMGSLTVHAVHRVASRILSVIEGNQGPEWLPVKIAFQSKTPVKIIFEAVLGSVLYSDIAVDNFLLRTCADGYQTEYKKTLFFI